MYASIKLDTIFILAAVMVIGSASPIMPTTMQRLRSRLTSVDSHHSQLYDSIRTKRFLNPEKVLPMQAITGMEPVKAHLRYLDRNDEAEPQVVYTMLYESLLIFREAFRLIAIQEMVLEDRLKELDDLVMREPSFHIEVRRVYHDIDSLLQRLTHVMAQSDIPIPEFEPNIILESEVDGKICDQGCKHERNLYIHQQFNYFLDRMAYNIAALNEES